MNILVIGNGFDLAHGLPTKYTDFLEWIIGEYKYWEVSKKRGDKLPNGVKKSSIKLYLSPERESKIKIDTAIEKQIELWECIDDNLWIEYFLQCDMHGDENWIDFESEIKNVVKKLEENLQKIGGNLYSTVGKLPIPFFNNFFLDNLTYRKLVSILEYDLNRLIRCLEIYLDDYLKFKLINWVLPEIKKLDIDKIISFNYTNIYEKVYDKSVNRTIEYDYIHGKADKNSKLESNNMVLGIDEYLSDDRKNKDIEFIAFKKFYQRIYKQTGCKYKEWIYKIKNEDNKNREERSWLRAKLDECKSKNAPTSEIGKYKHKLKEMQHNLYIFGHFLDVTDKDILRDLILNDNVYTTIFYPYKDELGRKIANLVKVIGQEELIRRTGGSTKTIEFKLQKPMVRRTS